VPRGVQIVRISKVMQKGCDLINPTSMANHYEQPVNWARIFVLVAVALPVVGFLLERRWTGASRRIPLTIGQRVRLNSGSPIGLVVETGELVTIAWPAGEATCSPECLHRV
jgi:hypothetical protein